MKQNSIAIALVLGGLMLYSCLGEVEGPSCTEIDFSFVDENQLEQDIEVIDSLLAERGVEEYEIHSSGLRYVIVEEGSGESIENICSGVQVHYRGTLMSDGSEFDSSYSRGEPFVMSQRMGGLTGLIIGWQIGMPIIKKGGRITLYVPSAYAYGNRDLNGIPANSNLEFEIELLDIYN